MPILSAAQLAYIRSIKADNYTDTVAIYRSPSASGGKVGALALVMSSAACRIWEAAKAPRLIASLPEIAAARAEKIAFFPDSVDVRRGDELRVGTVRYKVSGLGVWQTTRAAALEKVDP